MWWNKKPTIEFNHEATVDYSSLPINKYMRESGSELMQYVEQYHKLFTKIITLRESNCPDQDILIYVKDLGRLEVIINVICEDLTVLVDSCHKFNDVKSKMHTAMGIEIREVSRERV